MVDDNDHVVDNLKASQVAVFHGLANRRASAADGMGVYGKTRPRAVAATGIKNRPLAGHGCFQLNSFVHRNQTCRLRREGSSLAELMLESTDQSVRQLYSL